MSRITVNQIMTQVAATVNQEATAPTAGSAEYLLWLEYINRAYFEWANATDWESLRRTFYPTVTGMSLATVALPLDFRKLAGEVILYDGDTERGTSFSEALPEQRGNYGVDDKYLTVRGDQASGFSLILNPATLASGASLEVQYFSMPTSLASPAEVTPIGDPQFLIDRSIAYIFEARSDSRFQLEETKARERLLTMVENANLAKFNSYAGSNFVIGPERKQGFRIGRD